MTALTHRQHAHDLLGDLPVSEQSFWIAFSEQGAHRDRSETPDYYCVALGPTTVPRGIECESLQQLVVGDIYVAQAPKDSFG